ncbi:MAG: stage 0 sporulation family protein [Clostridia bacterium]|nr:stage 0 sporulation family protein [Clostridia bacterium]
MAENKENKKRRSRHGRRHGKGHHSGAPREAQVAQQTLEESVEIREVENVIDECEVAPEAPEIPEGVAAVDIVGINFREAGKIYYFAPAGIECKVGDRVIVETARGVEIGTVKVANRKVPETDIVPPLKAITRIATKEDNERDMRNRELEMDAAQICKKKIAKHGLEMSLVAVEYTFDNSKLVFYFTCESRVDFRELVKDLASTFHTRIELRQIGIRDEAKMMGGLGVCGRKYCCAGFLTDFVQVSIKMAKEQNFSLNSAKVSGACGRLMCCLKYEHEVYEEAIRRMPTHGSLVSTDDGEGTVIEIKPLSGEIRVKLSDNEKDQPKLYNYKDVKVLRMGKRQSDKRADDEDAEDEE